MADKWLLPRKLQLTPKMREESARNQEIWRHSANTPFGNPSEAERERAKASIRIAELEKLSKGATEADTIAAIGEKLAQNYAIVGRYDLAAKSTSDKAKRDEYVEILIALKRDDTESCNCAEQHIYVKKEIWSPAHNRTMPLIACSNCGHLNFQPLPDSVREQRRKRHEALAEYKAGVK